MGVFFGLGVGGAGVGVGGNAIGRAGAGVALVFTGNGPAEAAGFGPGLGAVPFCEDGLGTPEG